MSTQAYRIWNAAGRPYRVATCITDLVEYAKEMGIEVLGVIGNQTHLEADPPQDHTPYPAKPWPGKLPDYVVTACDLRNGAHAGVLLEHAKVGQAPWVKYINFGGHHYDIRNNWEREYSGDEHMHVSCRSDYTYEKLTFNPLKWGTVTTNFERKADAAYNLFPTTQLDVGGGKLQEFVTPVAAQIRELERRVDEVENRSAGQVSDEQVKAAVREVLAELRFGVVDE